VIWGKLFECQYRKNCIICLF